MNSQSFPKAYNRLRSTHNEWKQEQTFEKLFASPEEWRAYKSFERARDNMISILSGGNRPVLMPGELIFLDKLGLIRENAPQGPY